MAEIFHRLNFIEAYGTGIRRIFSLYRDCATLPVINVTPNSFKMTLPNMNAGQGQTEAFNGGITPQMQTVLDYLQEYREATDGDIQKLLDIKRTRSFTLLKQMSDLGLIKITGRGANRRIMLSGE